MDEEGIRMIRALYEDRPQTDRELVIDYKDEIIKAQKNEVTITQLYEVFRKKGFKGGRYKFTKILQSIGLWKIRSRKNKEANPSRICAEPAPAVSSPAPVSEPAGASLHRVAPNGRKIWGGKNFNPDAMVEEQPKENTGEASPTGRLTQAELEKKLGAKAFF